MISFAISRDPMQGFSVDDWEPEFNVCDMDFDNDGFLGVFVDTREVAMLWDIL